MESLPVQVLLGIYLGLLTGIVPALVAGSLGFVFRYLTGVSIPGFGVVVLALAVAGVNGGLLALNDPTIRGGQHGVALLSAILVVLMLALYAHSKGDSLGATLPRRVSLRELTNRTLSTDVVELVGGRGQVRVTVTGEVGDMEGYPPLPAELRREIREAKWTFPADVPLDELESRVADRLRTDFDVADASVRLDERAKATVAAAPPAGGLSKRIAAGTRAVSVDSLLPTGLARGDDVRLRTAEATVAGTVVSANSSGGEEPIRKAIDPPADPTVPGGVEEDDEPLTDGGRFLTGTATDSRTDGGRFPTGTATDSRTDGGRFRTDGGEGEETPAATLSTPTTDGGEGRLTVAVNRGDAAALLSAQRARVTVRSRGTRREFELTSLLRRAGQRFRRLTVVADGPLDDTTIGEAAVRDEYGVAILALRHERWRIAPDGDAELAAGDDLFVVGTREALAAFEEAAV